MSYPSGQSLGNLAAAVRELQPVTNLTELAAKFGRIGDAWQINAPLRLTSGFALGATQLELVGGTIVGDFPTRSPISSEYPGPAVFGQGRMWSVVVNQLNPAGKCISLTSVGPPLGVTAVTLVGFDPGEFDNCAGGVTVNNMFIRPVGDGAPPLRLTGTIPSFSVNVARVSPTGPADHTLIELDATYFTGTFDQCFSLSTNAGDRLFKLTTGPSAATNTLLIDSCSVEGPAMGQLYDTGLDSTSVEVIATGGNGPDSAWDGSYSSSVSTAFAHGVGTWEAMPSTGLTQGPIIERFALDAGVLKGTGRSPNLRGQLLWQITCKKTAAGGDRDVRFRVMRREGDLGTPAVVAGSENVIALDSNNVKSLTHNFSDIFTSTTQFFLETFDASGSSTTFEFRALGVSASR